MSDKKTLFLRFFAHFFWRFLACSVFQVPRLALEVALGTTPLYTISLLDLKKLRLKCVKKIGNKQRIVLAIFQKWIGLICKLNCGRSGYALCTHRADGSIFGGGCYGKTRIKKEGTQGDPLNSLTTQESGFLVGAQIT